MSRLLRSKFMLLLLGTLLVFSGISLFNILRKNYEIERESARLKREVSETESRNLEISKLIETFSASGALEKEARLRLNVKKPGEEVLILPPASSQPAAPAVAAETAEPFRAYLWSLVRGLFERSVEVLP